MKLARTYLTASTCCLIELLHQNLAQFFLIELILELALLERVFFYWMADDSRILIIV